MKYTFKIKGLDCANCASQLENALQKIDAIENVSISFLIERMVIELQEEKTEEIMKKIKKVIKKEEPDVKIEEI